MLIHGSIAIQRTASIHGCASMVGSHYRILIGIGSPIRRNSTHDVMAVAEVVEDDVSKADCLVDSPLRTSPFRHLLVDVAVDTL
eukprot:12146241-Prorocentrum_lima.AAC.1